MRLPASFRDASIRRKLMFITFLATVAATLFAMLALSVLQWFLLREDLVKSVHAQASIVAANSTAALVFNDRESAEQTLGALAVIDNIEFAGLLDKTGKNLAVYVRPGLVMPPHQHPAAEGKSHIFSAKYLEVVIPIVFRQERIGMIHVRSNLAPVYDKLAWSMLVIVVAATGAFLVAVMMLLRLLPTITDPLQYLVGLMNTVSRDNNYTLRAELCAKDELGMLAQGFNDMLAQVQSRDAELARYREHLEAEVAQRTARLTEAQRIAHLGNWEWDVVNNRLDWSDEIYRIFGLAPQQFGATYEAFLQAVHPEDQKAVNNEVRAAQEQGRSYSIDHRILLPDGTVRHVHEQGEVFRNDAGQAIKMLGTVQDITESKQVEEKIRKLNEELETKVQERTQQLLAAQEELVRKEKLAVLGQVAGSVGHELRNPLAVMSNAVYFLQTVLFDADETTREYLDIIKDEIAGSERIVSDLLDSVRTKPPQPETVGVCEVIGQTLGKLTIPPSVSVKLDILETLPALRVDPMQIQQVFRNLISNGVEAMPDGGTLAIRAVENRQEGTVTVSVQDSGVGMTPEQQNHLFQPLFTTKARGIGLGLVVVKNLTQANSGHIEVQSEWGKGSTFFVTLPGGDIT